MPYEETEKSNRPTTGQRRRPRQMAFQPEEPGKMYQHDREAAAELAAMREAERAAAKASEASQE